MKMPNEYLSHSIRSDDRNIKICFVSLSSYGYFNTSEEISPGGAQRQLYLLSQELQNRFSVSFIVGDYNQPPVEIRDGITLYSSYKPDPTASISREFRNLISLFKALQRVNADLYIYRGNPRKAAAIHILTSIIRKPMVYNIANDADITSRVNSINPILVKVFHRALCRGTIIAQTERQQDLLRSRFGVDSTIVPNGYKKSNVCRPFDQRDYFLWVGSIEKNQKRPHVFLDLAEKSPEEKFVLIGPLNGTNSYVKEITDRSNSLENVTFVGYVDPDEIYEYYEYAKALICTSSYEGFPNTFLEAWRVGTPVLSHSIDPGRFLDSPGTGFVDGIEELTEVVRIISEDQEYWEVLSDCSHRYFESHYTVSTVAERYANVLYQAISK